MRSANRLHDGAADDSYPRFSDGEMARRRRALHEIMEERGVDHVLAYGAERNGSAVPWLTGWPVTREAGLVVTPGEPDALFVQHRNHVPLARQIARDADVHWGGTDTIAAVGEVVRRRGRHRHGNGGVPRTGVIGPLPYRAYHRLSATMETVDLGADYISLRLRKSTEELAWLREGARLSDLGISALEAEVRTGMTEHELVDLVERAYVPRGGATHIHYFGVTAMAEPHRCVPAQFPSGRRVRSGDVLTVELSAAYWGYPGQVLRTWTIDTDATPLYRRLHDVAETALEAMLDVLRDGAHTTDLVAASSVIEDAGFTTCDDLVHGFGGGYLPPVLVSSSQQHGPVPDMTLREGMVLVLQPNVVTPDSTAGVQTGELVAVTHDGHQRLHTVPGGLRRIG